MPIPLYSWEEFSQLDFPEPEFHLNPYVPRGGITFLWGDTSIGKSPLTWAMAAAMGAGTGFFGLPTIKSRVLYLDVDTPLQSLQSRVKLVAPPPENVHFLVTNKLSVPFVPPESSEMEELKEAAEAIRPEVVFVNTLRNVHDLDDKDSKSPKLVYSFFQKLFKGAALIFIHHEKKHSTDPRAVSYDKETFSGAKNWLNDAQVGLHLETFKGDKWKENLRLYHRKSQVSTTLRPLPLLLGKDGTNLSSPLYSELLSTYEWLNIHGDEGTAAEMDAKLAQLLGCSSSTAKKRRLSIERGDFPGSTAWLARDDDDE